MNNKDEFYKRQITLSEVGTIGQEKLANASVLVIGAGGLGCPVLEYLAAAGVGEITICDYDKVDYTNLHRQVLYTPEHVGEYKAIKSSERLSKQNPHIKINTILKRFDLSFDISSYDLLLDCSDNFETKFMLHDLCYKENKNLIQASIHKFEGQVQVFKFNSDKNLIPCLRCLWPSTPTKDCVQSCNEAGVLGVVPGVIGAIQGAEAIKLLLDLPTLATGETQIINLLNFSTQKIKWSKDDNCNLCSLESKDQPEFDYGQSRFEVEFSAINNNNNNNNYTYLNLTNSPQSLFTNAINTNLDNLVIDTQKIPMDKSLLIFCNKGITSLKATEKLRSLGYENCYSLKDGIAHLI